MNFKAHLSAGVIAGLTIPIIARKIGFDIPNSREFYMIPAVILGSVLPDIDTKSVPSKFYAVFSLLALIIFAIKKMPWHGVLLITPYLLAKIGKHRGFTHSNWIPILIIISPIITRAIYIFFPISAEIKKIVFDYYWLLLSFAIGVFVHKFLDLKVFKRFGK